MITWRDVTAMEERNKDLMRRAEKERLIRQMMAKRKQSALWQSISKLAAGTNEKRVPARKQAHCAQKSA